MKTVLAVTACVSFLFTGAALATVGGGDISLENRGGTVEFSHDLHVSEVGLGCKECHTKLYLDIKRHRQATMKEMQKGKSCGACHNGKKAFSVKGACAKCHRK
ncbi:MAG: hypothetical protein A2075_10185 [Geobacteraceae bacterium GWC2_58_44]|nr:MAG: hypothetical protein A2075_10185 [Geobacteraceae bacterium GWC2_58_44]HBG06675.1 hypothetical protein [Geobacter sp.]